jgi:hypothetical protein
MSTLPELIDRIRKESRAAAAGLDDQVAIRLLRAAFRTIASDVEKAPDGVYKVAALGAFRVQTAEGQAGKPGGRRVVFKAAPAKPKMPNTK